MNTTNPLKHHYVPVCYLKNFTNTQKVFWKRRKDNCKVSICNPNQVCYEIDAFKFKTEEYLKLNNIIDQYHIEKFAFRRQENNYNKILEQLLNTKISLSKIDKDSYILFLKTLISIKRRNPKTRSKILEAFNIGYNSPSIFQEFKSDLLKNYPELDDSEFLDNYINNFINKKAKDPNGQYDMYLTGYLDKVDYTIIQSVTNQLSSLQLQLLISPANEQFITSDNPGFTKCGQYTLSLGGFGGEYEFFFPLNPNTCLYLNSNYKELLNREEKIIERIDITKDYINLINYNTKNISNKHLFSKSKEQLESI